MVIKIEQTLDKVFNEQNGKTQNTFEQYKNIYGLSTIPLKIEVSKSMYDYVFKKQNFVLLLLYDNDGNVYLNTTIADTLYNGLPGKGINTNETIHKTLTNIAKSISEKLCIGDVEPLAFIENMFTHKNKSHTHHGIAFACRILNKSSIKESELEGRFTKIDKKEMKDIRRLASRDVVKMFRRRYKDIRKRSGEDFQDIEISTNSKYKNRYKIHNSFMKKYILTKKLKKKDEFKGLIKQEIGNNVQSIIDTSCGDDSFVFDLGKELGISKIVGNDISWSQIELLEEKHDNVLFTNHNITALPFVENAFDVSYCSNTLHHMPNRQALKSLLDSLFHISKKIVLVEIENPKEIGGIPYLLNKHWFMGYLKDVGGAYLTEEQFKTVINETFENRAKTKLQTFNNIMGKYMIATITKEEIQ